jgi:hypothetical protein
MMASSGTPSGNGDFWDAAEACASAPTPETSELDTLQRPWGWQGKQAGVRLTCTCLAPSTHSSCSSIQLITRPPSPCPYSSNTHTAPSLPAHTGGRSCAYKDASGAALGFAAQASMPTSATSTAATWAAAPRCPTAPKPATSVLDASGRLWGYSNSTSCAFKSLAAKPIYYAGYTWAACCMHVCCMPAAAPPPAAASTMLLRPPHYCAHATGILDEMLAAPAPPAASRPSVCTTDVLLQTKSALPIQAQAADLPQP